MIKVPKTMGACVDLLVQIREKKAELNKMIRELEEDESMLKGHLQSRAELEQTSGFSGKTHNLTFVKDNIPQVADWDALYAYIVKKKAFHLLQKRLAEASIKEIWAENKVVPGVQAFEVVKTSIKKL